MKLESLPIEILIKIHEFMEIKEAQQNRVVAKFLNEAIDAAYMWKFFLERDVAKQQLAKPDQPIERKSARNSYKLLFYASKQIALETKPSEKQKRHDYSLFVERTINRKSENFTKQDLYNAIDYGDLSIVKYLDKNHKLIPDLDAFYHAIPKNDENFVQYLRDNKEKFKMEFDQKTLQKLLFYAIKHGSLYFLEYLRDYENQCNLQLTSQHLLSAVKSGFLPTVKYLIEERGLKVTQDIRDELSSGEIRVKRDITQYLQQQEEDNRSCCTIL